MHSTEKPTSSPSSFKWCRFLFEQFAAHFHLKFNKSNIHFSKYYWIGSTCLPKFCRLFPHFLKCHLPINNGTNNIFVLAKIIYPILSLNIFPPIPTSTRFLLIPNSNSFSIFNPVHCCSPPPPNPFPNNNQPISPSARHSPSRLFGEQTQQGSATEFSPGIGPIQLFFQSK
jgi:hypothetical protein